MSVKGGACADLLVILDGLAEPLSLSTTLALGRTPFLDRLVRAGRLRRIDPQDAVPAHEISSERGIARLLGYSPDKIKTLSRASLLAQLSPTAGSFGDFFVATPVFLDRLGRIERYVNPPEVENQFWRILRAHITGQEPWSLLPVYASDGRIDRMVVGVRHPIETRGTPPRRGLAIADGPTLPGFHEWITRTIPSSWKETAGPDRGVNGVWLWGGGGRLFTGTEGKRRSGFLLVGAAQIVRALGVQSGFRVAPLIRSTGDTDTDLSEKIGEVEKGIFQGETRIVLHIEGYDMASHRKDPKEKKAFLERTDRTVFSKLYHWFENGGLTSLCITSDHQSSPLTGNHESGPVPALTLNRGDAGGDGPDRMTEWALREHPVTPMEEWIQRYGDHPSEDGADFPGKDLCLAL